MADFGNERVIWIVGLLGAVAAAVGITVAVTSKAATTPSPTPNPPGPPIPPEPPPPHPPGPVLWVPASSIDPGKTYRVSVPGDPTSTAVWQNFLNSSQAFNGATIYSPGSSLPSDWPLGDTDLSRWRAQFSNNSAAQFGLLPIPGVMIWVKS